jgi:hypothetical protein
MSNNVVKPNFDPIDRAIKVIENRQGALSSTQILWLLTMIDEWFNEIPYDASEELNRAEQRLKECIMWLEAYDQE